MARGDVFLRRSCGYSLGQGRPSFGDILLFFEILPSAFHLAPCVIMFTSSGLIPLVFWWGWVCLLVDIGPECFDAIQLRFV